MEIEYVCGRVGVVELESSPQVVGILLKYLELNIFPNSQV